MKIESKNNSLKFYANTLAEIKNRIQIAQTKAVLSANSEMIYMYWDIGEIIFRKRFKYFKNV